MSLRGVCDEAISFINSLIQHGSRQEPGTSESQTPRSDVEMKILSFQ